MRVTLACVLVGVAACTAACGGTGAAHQSQGPPGVTAAERRAFFNDWYADGRIDNVYSCAVVQDALRRLPTDKVYSRAPQVFERYAKRVC